MVTITIMVQEVPILNRVIRIIIRVQVREVNQIQIENPVGLEVLDQVGLGAAAEVVLENKQLWINYLQKVFGYRMNM